MLNVGTFVLKQATHRDHRNQHGCHRPTRYFSPHDHESRDVVRQAWIRHDQVWACCRPSTNQARGSSDQAGSSCCGPCCGPCCCWWGCQVQIFMHVPRKISKSVQKQICIASLFHLLVAIHLIIHDLTKNQDCHFWRHQSCGPWRRGDSSGQNLRHDGREEHC